MTQRVLGPSGSRRRKTRLLLLTALTAAAFTAFFVVGAGAIVNGSPSQFESQDGNMTLSATGQTDWNCFSGSDNFGSGNLGNSFTSSDCAVTTGATQVTADPNGEITWVNGQKFDTQCPALQTGNVPNKDDFTNIAEYQETANSGDLYFYGGAIRQVSNGNASGDVEFNQSAGDGTTTAGCRTAGDRLIAYDFTGGGQQPLKLVFHVLTWIDSTNSTVGMNNGTCFVKQDSMPCWGAHVLTPDSSVFDGASNAAAIAAADNAISGGALDVQQFAEFGINLTQALGGGPLPCFPQQVWESRSSGSSFTSNPEDIEFAHLSTCGSIKIIKHTNPRGLNQVFSYTSNLPQDAQAGGVNASPCTAAGVDASGNFCLNDNLNTTGDNSANTVFEEDLPATTYTVTEGADPTGFAFDSVTCKKNGTTDNSVVSGRTVTIALAANDSWVCTYVNNQQLGAIKVTKTSTKGDAALAGATFVFKKGTTTIATKQTDANGVACVDGLAFGSDYSVQETAAPTGYKINDTTLHSGLNVNTNTTCSGTPSVSLSFSDTPLSKIYLGWHSLAGNGVTTATIQCTGESSASTFSDGGSTPTITKTLGDGSSTLIPGTYSCTVVIDP